MTTIAIFAILAMFVLFLWEESRIAKRDTLIVQWDNYARSLETEIINLKYRKTHRKHLTDDLSIGMLPGFDHGASKLIPVMDTEGIITLVDPLNSNSAPQTDLVSPDIAVVPDQSYAVEPELAYRIASVKYNVPMPNVGSNQTKNSSNGKGKNSGNKSNNDHGSFEPANTDLFGNDSEFWTLVTMITDDRNITDGKLPKDQFNKLKELYAQWVKQPASLTEYQKRFDKRFPK